MGLIDKVRSAFGISVNPQTGTGMVRLGGNTYSATWHFTRVLDSVYANPTARRCIERIANDFQRPDWQLRPSGTEDDIPNNDPRYNLFLAPNESMDGTMMQYHISRDLDLSGGTLWLKERAGPTMFGEDGEVLALRRLAPQRVSVIADEDDELLGFVYQDRLGKVVPLLPYQVVYVNYPHPDRPADRMAPALVAGLPAETDNAAMKFNFELLSNDSALPGYIVVENLAPSKFREWVESWQAAEQPGKTRFLSGNNAKYVKVGQTNQELTYSSLRADSREDICRSFGPPRVLIDPTDATFSNMDVATRSYMRAVIDPRWTLVSAAFTRQLGIPDMGGIEIGFNLDDIPELQEALDALVDRSVKLLDKGVLTINDVRRDLKLPPVEWGDAPALPPAMSSAAPAVTNDSDSTTAADTRSHSGSATVRALGAGTQKARSISLPDLGPQVARAERRAQSSMERFFDRQANAIAKRVEGKKGRTKATEDWWDGDRWNAELTELWQPILGDTVEAIGGVALSHFGSDDDLDAEAPSITRYLSTRSQEIATLVNTTTADEVRDVIARMTNEGASVVEVARGIREYVTGRSTTRALTIARTEIIGAANFGAIEGARQSGVVTAKRWLAASDAEENCLALQDREAVGLDESWDGVAQPPLHPNCRCTLTFEIKEQE